MLAPPPRPLRAGRALPAALLLAGCIPASEGSPASAGAVALALLLVALFGAATAALGATVQKLRDRDRHRVTERQAATWQRVAGESTLRTDAALVIIEGDGGATVGDGAAHPWHGRPLPDLLLDRGENSLADLLAAHAEVARHKVALAHDDKTELELAAMPLHDERGRFEGYLGALRPWSAAGSSVAAEDDAALFSFTVSHDLRAPLRVVDGFARILKEDYGPSLDRVANDHLDRVLGAAGRMNQMIDALLAMARLATQPMVRQAVDLSQLARFIVEDLRRTAPDRAIEIDIEPGLIAHGDPTLLRQVLENLIGNAWKYTQRTREPRITVDSEIVAGRRAIVVRDNGAGFDMRAVDRLFGMFQRLHSASEFPGTGVGLASVKRIVSRHGGHIWAEAEPGRGATFRFTLRE